MRRPGMRGWVGMGMLSAILLSVPILYAQDRLLPSGVIRSEAAANPALVANPPEDHSSAATGVGIDSNVAQPEVEAAGVQQELEPSGVVRGQVVPAQPKVDAAAGVITP